MGLAIEVGILADLRENDEDGFAEYENQFRLINEFLAASGLPQHTDPLELSEEQVLSFEMWGYSGLHYLRRIAAHVAETGMLPPPGDDDSSDDPILQKFYAKEDLDNAKFGHLLLHSDADGYYLPIPFNDVLFAPDDLGIDGDMVGSSYQLLAECEELAELLEIPPDLDPESDEVWDAADAQGEGEIKWKKYGVESFVCIRLIHAARYSIETGAAIVFC